MKFLIKTLGCKVNQSESDQIADQLVGAGYHQVQNADEADLIVVNTCTVTSVADAKARQLISKMAKSPKAKIVVTGCAVNNIHSGLSKFENVEFVRQEDKLETLLLPLSWESGKLFKSRRSRPLLKIQDGCDHQCSYCIVPIVRGPSKSLPVKQIINQAQKLIDAGYQEIVLTGVDIGAYNYKIRTSNFELRTSEKQNKKTLVDLIKELLSIADGFRVRLSSLEPQSITDEFIDYFAKEHRICNHIHLPLQSGSDTVLAAMNRPYRIDDIKNICARLRHARADLAITTDIIVGFPGEFEPQFQQSIKAVRDFGFSKCHIFRYSDRKGAKAADLDFKVEAQVKKERAQVLQAAADIAADDFKKSLVGKELEVLVERKDGKYLKGISSNYCAISIEESVPSGKLTKVEVNNYDGERLFGKLV